MKNVIEIAPETVETAAAPVVAPIVKTAPKQTFVGCTPDTKAALQELAKEFIGPGVTKSYPMTEKEVVDLIYFTATANRYSQVQEIDEDGEAIYDEDGEPVLVEVDNFQTEVKRIFAMRDSKPEKVNYNSKESLEAQMAKIMARLKELELTL